MNARSMFALCAVLLAAGCGGESGGEITGGAAGGVGAADESYSQGYNAAWLKACEAAVAELRRDVPKRAAAVSCERPVEQMEGNTSFDPEQARIEGARQGTFDGCAYAWDEAYATSAVDVQPRC